MIRLAEPQMSMAEPQMSMAEPHRTWRSLIEHGGASLNVDQSIWNRVKLVELVQTGPNWSKLVMVVYPSMPPWVLPVMAPSLHHPGYTPSYLPHVYIPVHETTGRKVCYGL